MTHRRLLFIFLGALTALRLIYIAVPELSPDEAYYTMWSERMDICYYSKGPGVAAAIWAGTHLFGMTAFGVRVFSPLLALGTSLLMFSFARRLYRESVAIWTVLTINAIPIFEAGAMVMTIDPLSIFFWMAALLTFWRALERPGEWSGWWPATGALIGIGFLCKYTNALEYLSIVALLLCTRKHRREFLRTGFWAMTLAFLLFTWPPIFWNSQHDWITIHHLTLRGHLEKAAAFHPMEFLKFLGLHFGVYSPLIFAGMLASIWWGWGKARSHFRPRFLLAFGLPIFALYIWLSFKQAGEPNWTAPGTLSLGLLAVALWHDLAREKPWARRFALTALAVGVLMSVLTLNADALRWAHIPLPYGSDPSARLRGWESTAELVGDFRKNFEAKSGAPVFLIANRYQTAAELAFYMHEKRPAAPGHPPVYIPESQDIQNEFSLWPRYDETPDLATVARNYLESAAAGGDPIARDAVKESLRSLNAGGENEEEIAKRKRALVRALKAADPKLPLDESDVEEQGPNLFAGRTALYITDRTEERAPSTIQGGFEKAEMIACIDLKRYGLPLRQIRIFACYNYHGMSL